MQHTSTVIKPLTSIRGIAALWVYLFHSAFSIPLTSGSILFNKLVWCGSLGVDIFFILSGFIISYVHLHEFSTLRDARQNTLKFLALRLSRIYPLHILTLLLLFGLEQLSLVNPKPSDTISNFVQHIFLVQSWGLSGSPLSKSLSWNAVAWSISIEWLLYLLFPLLALTIARKAKGALSSVLMIILMIALWIPYLHTVGADENITHPGVCIPRGILDFVIGMALCNLFRLGVQKNLPWDVIAILILFGAMVLIQIYLVNDLHAMLTFKVLMLMLMTLLIYALANVRTFAHRVFSHPALVYLGTISYSFYMLHWFYVIALTKFSHTLFNEPSFFTWRFLCATLALLGMSAVSYHIIEKPARQWGRRLIMS